MSYEAGPSLKEQSPGVLAEADKKFEAGVQAIRDNNLEAAVELFAGVLEVRTKHYGDLAPECASAYYRYGAALLYQAQDSVDVFAGGAPGSEEPEGDKENDDSRPPSAAIAAAPPSAADDRGKGKAPVAEAPASDDEDGEEEEGRGASAEAAESDLQLAWENLETAKVIWSKEADKHAKELADVHLLLGDVAMESDDFEMALTEVEAGLAFLQKTVEADDRRIAEAQYKRCMALQFSNRPQEALEAVKAAVACLQAWRGALEARVAALPEGAPEEESARLAEELADVGAVLGDLQDKVAELEDLVSQDEETKGMLKGVLGQLGAAMGGASATGPPTERGQPKQQQRGPTEQTGFDAPRAGSSSGAGAAAAPSAAPVQNLGVVGRGTKRIKLQPTAVGAPTAVATGGGEAGGHTDAGATAGEKKKRSLEELMGGSGGGETTVGFGAAAAVAAAAPLAPKAAQPANEAAATAPALPAFLQAAKVQEVYKSPAAAGTVAAKSAEQHDTIVTK